MVKEYTTSARIDAKPDAVWAVLADAARYGEWNPEIVGVEGKFGAGERIRVRVRVKGGAGKMVVRAVPMRVTVFEPARRMVWVGGLPLGLFRGERTLTVRTMAGAGGGAEFRMDLRMSGLLAGMILKSVGDRQPEIESFSEGLKRRVEGK